VPGPLRHLRRPHAASGSAGPLHWPDSAVSPACAARLIEMPSVLGESCALVAAGILAGAIGAAGGITSLVSYSALLSAGVPPLAANVSNLVAAVACWPGSALTSRRELAVNRRYLRRALPLAGGAAAVGAVLLLYTPPGVFSRVVPFLIAIAAVALLVQPWLTARARATPGRGRQAAWLLLGLVSIYAGFFGAGSGIMLLTLLLVAIDDRVPEANALKNMLLGVTAVASAIVFILAGPVDWTATAPLALGLFVGSAVGPLIARRLPAHAIRWGVAALGFALAVELWLRPAENKRPRAPPATLGQRRAEPAQMIDSRVGKRALGGSIGWCHRRPEHLLSVMLFHHGDQLRGRHRRLA